MPTPTPNCDFCDLPMQHVTEPRLRRREGEFATADQTYWRCPRGCLEFDGTPFALSDRDSDEVNEKRIHDAWVTKYGHAPPKFGSAANNVIAVRLTPELVAQLDKARGLRSRSSFLRAWLTTHLAEPNE